jgi:hypothetical protein
MRQCEIECYEAAETFAVNANWTLEVLCDVVRCVFMTDHELVEGMPTVLRHDEHVEAALVKAIRKFGEHESVPT